MGKSQRERILYFDLIKLIAMLCVFVCHFTRSLEAAGVGFDFKILPDTVFSVYLGSFGVTLFFIVSGAALMYVYEEKIDIKTYIIKRLKGIYPLFWLTYLFAFFITFYENAGMNQGIPKARIIYSILGCDGNMLWFGPNFYMVGEWFFLSRLPEFVFGMFFIKVIRTPKWWLGLAGAFVLILAAICSDSLVNTNAVLKTEVVGIAAFCFLSWCLNPVKGPVIEKISSFVNRYTYGIFLTHHFVQAQILQKFTGKVLQSSDVILAFLLCMIVTLAATVFLFRLNKKILERGRNNG